MTLNRLHVPLSLPLFQPQQGQEAWGPYCGDKISAKNQELQPALLDLLQTNAFDLDTSREILDRLYVVACFNMV
jgi:hypothetical protein